MSGPYDDIINLPHHVSCKHPQMPVANRAAQFAPFAALTGYDAAIGETARLTDMRLELDENALAELNLRLRILSDKIDSHPEVSITHFRVDEKKDGGAYVYTTGRLKKIDEHKRLILLLDGKRIAIDDIIAVESELLKGVD